MIAVILSLFAGRLVQMQGLDWTRYRVASAQQLTKTLPIPTIRGSITTSDGTILAMTEQTEDIAADPAQMPGASLKQAIASALAGPLAMSAATLLSMLENPPARSTSCSRTTSAWPMPTRSTAWRSRASRCPASA